MVSREQPLDSRLLVFVAIGLAILGWQVVARDMVAGAGGERPEHSRGVYFWNQSEEIGFGLCRRNFSDLERELPAIESQEEPRVNHASLQHKEKKIMGALPPRGALLFFLPIPVNDADEELLTAIHGIGPVLAARIVAYRERSGPLKSEQDLQHIQGIGPGKLKQLAPQLSFQ